LKLSENIRVVLDNLPARPGVYIFKDASSEIIYVGKATRLCDRVRSYFNSSHRDSKTELLVENIDSIETITVENEAEALEVEYNLIKEHRPRFNISYRDDKSYPHIKITSNEPYPRVFVTRRKIDDGSIYFGPYTGVGSMRRTLKTIREIFPYRSCNDRLPPGGDDKRFSLCLDYHLKQCDGPCVGLQDTEEYGEMIADLKHFLKGDYAPVRRRLKNKMEEYSGQKKFEAAAIYRDRLQSLEKFTRESTFIESTQTADVLGLGEAEGVTTVLILRIRENRLVNRLEYPLEAETVNRAEALRDFIITYYLAVTTVPPLILVGEDLADQKWLEDKLTRRAGRKVKIKLPGRGEKKRLAESAARSARLAAKNESLSMRRREGDMLRLAMDFFDLPELPRVIEGFDISTLQGHQNVAGMVRFVNAEPEKEGYRRFKLREIEGVDDYGALREVIGRRYRKLLEEDDRLPDLVFVDGGPGQLQAALDALKKLKLDLPVISLAKRRELLYRSGVSAPYDLPEDSTLLQLFQRIRDEAHRFAISFHRDRRQGTLKSRLREINGIGAVRLSALINRFGSPSRVKQASLEELTQVSGITEQIAREIIKSG
jgi:excinuclease ABC subunit C